MVENKEARHETEKPRGGWGDEGQMSKKHRQADKRTQELHSWIGMNTAIMDGSVGGGTVIECK